MLQHLTLTSTYGDASDVKPLSFGLREISFNDKDMFLNGKLLNIRATHFGGDFPLLGHPAMDVDSWEKNYPDLQGLRIKRHEIPLWCPPEAAFEAADELGSISSRNAGFGTVSRLAAPRLNGSTTRRR